MDLVKLKKALKGVRIEVTHRGDTRQKYRIASFTNSPPSSQFFESSAGVQKSVADYFREAYHLEMHYDFLPCLQVGSDQRPNYLPMEVCKIVAEQKYRKKLEGQQVSKLMDSTCQRPSLREDNICQIVEQNDYNKTERASEFGMEVDYRPTSVQARVLPAPTLKYRGTGSDSFCCPKDDGVGKFCSHLVKWSRTTGVDMDNLRLPIYTARPEQAETDIRRLYQDAWNKLRGQKFDLLLAILPEKNGSLYDPANPDQAVENREQDAAVGNENPQEAEIEGNRRNWLEGVLKEIQLVVVGFVASLLPGFQHND
uniref:PAZ domain-containing protein n=2 Tax=Zea mays TaxID=4577 RepID=A0A804UJL2_MAIZE